MFRFAALQSERGKALASRFNINTLNLETFVLIVGDKFYIKSTAALMVCKELNSLLKILYPFIILPALFRDFVYDVIAKNRYKLFGIKESCRIPVEEEKEKFLLSIHITT